MATSILLSIYTQRLIEMLPEDVDKSCPDIKFRVTYETDHVPKFNQSAAVSNFNDSPYVYGLVSAMPI